MGELGKPAMSEDLTALVLRAQSGDLSAFEQIVVQTQRTLFYTILRVVCDRHIADDLVQEVFIKVHGSLPELKSPDLFRPWLHRIAMNRAIDRRRAMKKEAERVFLVDEFFGKADPAREEPRDLQEMASMEEAIQKAIDSLPNQQKVVMALTMEKNLSQEEIAVVMECPVGTIKSRLHHARKTLKERLRKWLGP
jgi:RNA polymerase sigma-70 factor, ECF subfamily